MKTIYLTGFMGAGKTTIGQAMGNVFQLPVIDLDHYIEEKRKKTIREIFETEGEVKFREYESDYLRELPIEDVIVTTGGGVIINDDNRKWMSENGHVIFLYCDLHEIFHRLSNDTTRPLLDGDKEEQIKSLYQKRMEKYKEAHVTIDTTNKKIEEIIDEIKVWIENR